jgi:alpha-L-fucosidase
MKTFILFILITFASYLEGYMQNVEAAKWKKAQIIPPPGDRKIKQGKYKPDWNSFKQYECPDWFRDAKFGIWAHWGPQCEPEQGDWYARRMYEQGSKDYNYHVTHYGHPSVFGFKDVINEWKADKWQPEKLMKLYKAAGAKFFVAMAVHHDNFDLYNSKYQEWNALNVGPHKDIVGGWQKAAKKYGLKFGVSDHAAATLSWWQSSKGADTSGPYAGVPYDGNLTKADGKGKWWEGLDPQDLYPPKKPVTKEQEAMFEQRWFMRAKDLIDTYHPDYFYHDWSNLPFGQIGMDLMAHFYNTADSLYGRTEVVMTAKNLKADQRSAMINDVERGGSDKLEPYPWEAGTCIGDWHYSQEIFEKHQYKTLNQILQQLADIISKNGTLLLSIPIKGNGEIDSDETAFLKGMGKWMNINGEAVFGTRPWKVFGEGPTRVTMGDMGEKNLHFTGADIRFTHKGNTLYVFLLDWPANGQIMIKSLHKQGLFENEISKVGLLGCNEPVKWNRTTEGLLVQLPANKPVGPVYVLKVL